MYQVCCNCESGTRPQKRSNQKPPTSVLRTAVPHSSPALAMTKGDDAVRRKRNKLTRKKLNSQNNTSSSVSARVAAIIASKKRRQSGKRRKCEGMCFSLPSPDDPFNDRHSKKDLETKITKKVSPIQMDELVLVKEKKSSICKQTRKTDAKVDDLDQKVDKVASLENEKKSLESTNNRWQTSQLDPRRTKTQLNGKGGVNVQQRQACENLDCPSKYLIMCLNEIESALRNERTYITEEDKPLFASTWGIEFWKCYSAGKDILETSGSSSSIEKIAWIVCSAADTISRKDEEVVSCTSPFLLFLVPSKEKAAKVRSVCKPLKVHGIHTVSIHTGASLDHQFQGLKNCEPEILISTPERLLELVSLKAIDISGVSLLVIDGLELQYTLGYLDTIKDIAQYISGNAHHLVFNDSFRPACVPVVQNLLVGPVHKLSLNNSVVSQSACISQSVKICNAQEEKLSKAFLLLDNAYDNPLRRLPLSVLFTVGKGSKFHKLVAALKSKGYSISTGSICDYQEVGNREESGDNTRRAVSVIDIDQIGTTDFSKYDTVIILDFVISIDNYIQILTRMARYTVNGVLHSILTDEDAGIAGPLIEILEKCEQVVPKALRNMNVTSSMVVT